MTDPSHARRRPRPDLWEIVLMVVLVVAVFLVAVWPRLPLSVQYVLIASRGHADVRCPWPRVQVSAAREAARLDAIEQQRLAMSDPYSEAGLLRRETPAGPIWAPPGSLEAYVAAVNPPQVRWEQIDAPDQILVRTGDIVIDCGGHLGESALRALQLGAARVVTVEPDRDNARALRKNLAQPIAEGRVVLIEKGVYDREGSLTFVGGVNSASGEFHEGERGGEALPVTTIDHLVAELQLARVDFIKMDIEGSEVPALRGAVETLRRFKPRLAVGTYHKSGDLDGIERAVLDARADYQVSPSRCLPYQGRVFPLLLFFH